MDVRERAVEELAIELFGIDDDADLVARGETDDRSYGKRFRSIEQSERAAWLSRASGLLARLGLVAIDPALVEAVRKARHRWENVDDETRGHGPDSPPWRKVVEDIARAESALADAVLAQLVR